MELWVEESHGDKLKGCLAVMVLVAGGWLWVSDNDYGTKVKIKQYKA